MVVTIVMMLTILMVKVKVALASFLQQTDRQTFPQRGGRWSTKTDQNLPENKDNHMYNDDKKDHGDFLFYLFPSKILAFVSVATAVQIETMS